MDWNDFLDRLFAWVRPWLGGLLVFLIGRYIVFYCDSYDSNRIVIAVFYLAAVVWIAAARIYRQLKKSAPSPDPEDKTDGEHSL